MKDLTKETARAALEALLRYSVVHREREPEVHLHQVVPGFGKEVGLWLVIAVALGMDLRQFEADIVDLNRLPMLKPEKKPAPGTVRPASLLRDRLYDLNATRVAVIDGPNDLSEIELWHIPKEPIEREHSVLVFVQIWRDGGGFDVYSPLDETLKIDSSFAKLRKLVEV